MKLQGKDKICIAVVVMLAGIAGIFLLYKFNDFSNRETVDVLETYVQRVRHKPEISDNQIIGESNSPSTSLGAVGGIANWQTYRNEEYGFEFEYPNGGFIENEDENCSYVRLQNYTDSSYGFGEGNYFIQIRISDQKYGKAPVLACSESVPSGQTVTSGSYLGFMGEVLYVGGPGGSMYELCLEKPGVQVRTVVAVARSNQILAEQILSTFKFIEN